MIKVRHMAQVCREAMGAVQEFVGRQLPVVCWEDLNDRQRRLSCNVVNHIRANPGVTPEACHNAWMGVMRHTEGFVYGEITSETAKTHMDLVPFEQLRPESKLAYAISIGVVRGLQSIQHRYENGIYNDLHPNRQIVVPADTFTAAELETIKAAGPSDVHFTGGNPDADNPVSAATLRKIADELHENSGVTQIEDLVTGEIWERTKPVVDHAAPGGDRTVEQVVDQVVESTDEPAATDPATAE